MRGYEEDTELERIALIATDMDHTLLAEDDSQPEGMADRIAALDEAGVTFVAASGRPAFTLLQQFPGVRNRMAFVADNGAVVICRGETILDSNLPPALVSEIIDFSMERGAGVPVACTPDTVYVLERDRVHEPYLSRSYFSITYVDALDGIWLGTEVGVSKFTLYFPDGDAPSARRDLFGPRFSDRLVVTGSGNEWLDLMNPGTSKGSSLSLLCTHLGVSPSNALAFGDSDNDVEMLELVGHSYVVANAERRIWPHARFLAPSNEDRGVATVVDRVLASRNVR